jgi:predicted amidophosphoribosyltransferase
MGPPQSTTACIARAANVADAFDLDPRWRARIAGADVVLVDDVLTSGATIRSAAEPLRSAGAIASGSWPWWPSHAPRARSGVR